VDDDPGIQDVAKFIFEKPNYEIKIFSSGAPLLKNDYELPNVIILDKDLPDIDGLEICRILKSKEKTKNIPVIMLSAHPDIKSLAKNAGADEAIEKPFNLKYIRETVRKYLDESQLA
jgi:DNA-binding response OmpR family regulator